MQLSLKWTCVLVFKGEAEGGAIALEMANVVGVFYLTIIGVVIAIIIAFILVVLETRTVCKENKVCFSYNFHSFRIEQKNRPIKYECSGFE